VALPIKTSSDDALRVIAYLKTKPTGASISDAKAVVENRLIDNRKLRAYDFWGLIASDGVRLSLTEDGREVARNPDAASTVFRRVIDRITPYRSAIEWAHHQGFSDLDLNDLAAHWHSHNLEDVGQNDTTLKDSVTCFFSLAEAAGLGRYVVGRHGNATRLELNRSDVADYVESGPQSPPWAGPESLSDSDVSEPGEDEQPSVDANASDAQPPHAVADQNGPLRVFIAHGKNMRVVEQVEVMLGLAGITAEVAEEEETAAIPVPEKVFTAMRRSGAGVICVSVDERHKDAEGEYKVNENVLIEIGAAYVLYDKRLVLLWDRRIKVPSNLQGLYRCEFEGDEIGWDAGMKLMKAVQTFKDPAV
jgi:predicted nucleotide-binding protein